jgi:DNA-binding IclR family transcriptional regulator
MAIKARSAKTIPAASVFEKADVKEPGVAAVDRALSIMCAFATADTSLSLHEIAARTNLYKSTILRLVASLERQGCIHRLDDGRYQLGPMVLHWSRVYNSSLRLEHHVIPVLNQLVQEIGEGASFFVREGNVRVCLFRVDAQRAIQEYVGVGDLLPLERGAAGRILLDFAPAAIAQSGVPKTSVYVSFGETDPEVTAIAVPVFGPMDSVRGSMSISGPRNRFTRDVIENLSQRLLAAAVTLSVRLGGDPKLLQLGHRPAPKRARAAAAS